tara:strand:- start:2237 stop:2482 length:246 start_codon:yes stop_codon:yes gene_type:complete
MKRLIPKTTAGKIWVGINAIFCVVYITQLNSLDGPRVGLGEAVLIFFGAYLIYYLIPLVIFSWVGAIFKGTKNLVKKSEEE